MSQLIVLLLYKYGKLLQKAPGLVYHIAVLNSFSVLRFLFEIQIENGERRMITLVLKLNSTIGLRSITVYVCMCV